MTTMVPARLGSLMASPHIASRMSKTVAILNPSRSGVGSLHNHNATASGIARSNQTGWCKIIAYSNYDT